MATVNRVGVSVVPGAASSARLGSHLLIAMGVAIVCTVLLTVLMTIQQHALALGVQTPRIPIASVFVGGLIFW